MRTFFFLILLLSSLQVSAQSLCTEVLLNQGVLDFHRMADLLLADGGKEEVMKFAGTVRTAKNGELRIIESINGEWRSGFVGNGTDPMGSPFYFPIIVGSSVASKFGFFEISANRMTVPSAESMNHSIQKANRLLKSQNKELIPIEFYETNSNAPVSGRSYLENIVNGKFPLEQDGALGIHDYSFHSSAILLPKEFYQRLQKSAFWIIQFTDYLQTLNNPLLKSEINKILKEAAGRADLSGNISPYLAYEALVPGMKDWSLKELGQLTGAQHSPLDFLTLIVAEHPHSMAELFKFMQTSQGAALMSDGKAITPQALGELLKTGIQENIQRLKQLAL